MIAPDKYKKPIDDVIIKLFCSRVKRRAYAITIPIKFIIDIIRIIMPDRKYCFFSFNLKPLLYEHYFSLIFFGGYIVYDCYKKLLIIMFFYICRSEVYKLLPDINCWGSDSDEG